MRRLLTVVALIFLVPTAALAAGIGDVVDVGVWEQVKRFFSFRDAALFYILGGGLLLGASCGLLGSFIVVRKMALLGDALSHAVLPGVAAGFMWNMTKDPVAILIGATVSGVLGAILVSWITSTTRIKQDAALGIVLSSFFAIGMCMIKLIEVHGKSGNISGIKQFLFGQVAALGEKDLIVMAIVTALAILLVVMFYGPLLVCSFDRAFARSIGLPVKVLDYMLVLFLTFAIVIALQAVGVVLVSALLITPAATAYLLTDRMHKMLMWAVFFGMLSAAIGTFLSFLGNSLPTGPFMVVGASTVFALAYLFAPRHGTVTRWLRRRTQSQRINDENTLKSIYRALEDRDFAGEEVTVMELANVRRETVEEIRKRVNALTREDLVTTSEGGNVILLTPTGHRRAWQVVRNHRLWELYLTNEADYSPDHVHEDAEKIEHILGEDVVRELERQLKYPEFDPHGKPIPSVPGQLSVTEGGSI
jgi:ABC-type Mn2+/Zn2+ transport system permease subunit/Mn-dependent DtxR family transcriptional regulator